MIIYDDVPSAIAGEIASHPSLLLKIGMTGGEPSILIGDTLSENDVIGIDKTPFILVGETPIAPDREIGLDIREQSYRLKIYGFDGTALNRLADDVRRVLNRIYAETTNGTIYLQASSGGVAIAETPNLKGVLVYVKVTKTGDF